MIRTRFAPSPTGYLHIGGARTALFSWLFAKHHQGSFILRIEDTDAVRSTPEAVEAIFKGMQWLGITPDEGPYFQTQRLGLYQGALRRLLASGNAYRCNCSQERLALQRAEQIAQKQKPRYDGLCRDKQLQEADRPYVIRFRSPQAGSIVIEDKIRGKVSFDNLELDDLVLARSDGTPTYHLTVVVDDQEMGITHVIRGDDHLNNTPKQVNLLQALNAPIPVYIHLPMIHGFDGKKLSKRTGAAGLNYYQKEGYLPEALINYLARLGWSHGDQEIFSEEELIQYFDGTHLTKAPSILNLDKLQWVNQRHIQRATPNRLANLLAPWVHQWQPTVSEPPLLSEVALIQRGRVKTLKEMAEKSRFFYEVPELIPVSNLPFLIIKQLYLDFKGICHWTETAIHEVLEKATQGIPSSQLFQVLRQMLTGSRISPPIDSTLKLIGKSQVLERLQYYLH